MCCHSFGTEFNERRIHPKKILKITPSDFDTEFISVIIFMNNTNFIIILCTKNLSRYRTKLTLGDSEMATTF